MVRQNVSPEKVEVEYVEQLHIVQRTIAVVRNVIRIAIAGADAEIGNDIICAAVSALTQGLVHSLKALTDDEISYHIADGHIDIEYKDLSEKGYLLVDSFFIAVSDIQRTYGTEYVQATAADGR